MSDYEDRFYRVLDENEAISAHNENLKAELAEQCRLLAMGSEREARLMARVEELERDAGEMLQALREIAHWRKGAWAYDRDMGNPPREWGEEEVVLIEACAQCAIDAMRGTE